MAHVLIVGAGYVGSHLAGILTAGGHRVTAVTRTRPPADTMYERVAADVTRPPTLAALPDAPDAVVCTLAPAARSADAYRDIFLAGTGNLLARYAGAPAPLLFVSSTGVYGQDRGEWVDEETPPAPTTDTGRIILEAEEQVLAARPDATVVRFSGIYGPGRTWLLDRVRGGQPVPTTPPSYTNRIHREDCAGVLAFLLARRLAGDPLPARVLASDDDPAPLAEVAAWVADRLEVPRPPAGPPGVAQNKRCSNRRLRDLGYGFRFPSYREGYAQVIDGLGGPTDSV